MRWSPSGKEIAIEWYNKEGIGELRVVNAETRQSRTLVAYPKGQGIGLKENIANLYPLGFTGAGSFYFAKFKARRDIYSFPLEPKTGKVTSAPVRMAAPFEGNSTLPEYSPDGKYLAMVERGQAGTAQQLIVQSLETAERRVLVRQMVVPRWSADSRSIVYYGGIPGDKQAQRGIVNIDVSSGKTAPLFIPPAGVYIYSYDLSHDGRQIAYCAGTTWAEIWVMENILPPAAKLEAVLQPERKDSLAADELHRPFIQMPKILDKSFLCDCLDVVQLDE